MDLFRLKGCAIVVGASGGIGCGVAASFAEIGVSGLLCADIDEAGAAETAAHCKTVAGASGCKILSVRVDCTSLESVQAMVDYATAEFGRIDYFVNSAGVDVAADYSFVDTPAGDYERVLSVNAKGALFLMQAAVRAMKAQEPLQVDMGRHGVRDFGRGAIVNISSAMSFAPVPYKTSYVASKHALLGLAKSCALENRFEGIRVNTISPTWVRTPMHDRACERNPINAIPVQKLAGTRRFIEKDEIAAACLFLCGPSAASITGINLAIDTGLGLGAAALF
jgi:NAD(P)-dependent dehydrogenase (short-subunit alcohol dehydrogenase family)